MSNYWRHFKSATCNCLTGREAHAIGGSVGGIGKT